MSLKNQNSYGTKTKIVIPCGITRFTDRHQLRARLVQRQKGTVPARNGCRGHSWVTFSANAQLDCNHPTTKVDFYVLSFSLSLSPSLSHTAFLGHLFCCHDLFRPISYTVQQMFLMEENENIWLPECNPYKWGPRQWHSC